MYRSSSHLLTLSVVKNQGNVKLFGIKETSRQFALVAAVSSKLTILRRKIVATSVRWSQVGIFLTKICFIATGLLKVVVILNIF